LTARARWALVTILAFALALRLVFAVGISGNDDMSVASAAIKVLDYGLHVPAGHYEARLGLVLPLVGLFAAFGVNVFALLIVPMAASLLGIFLAFKIGQALFDTRVGLIAACVLAVYPMDVEYAGLYFPDLIQGCLMALAFSLLLKTQGRDSMMEAVAAGLVWGFSYYVKEDAVFLGPVLLLGAVLGYIAWPRMILAGLVALGCVGLELVAYGLLTGHPFLHADLVRRANDEVLAANMDYRDIWTYPKAMFFNPHETGMTFYVALLGLVFAARRPSRPLVMVIGWCAVFYLWLSFGFDPFSMSFRLKPQLSRYLQDFSIPLSVLVGWTLTQIWYHAPRLVSFAGASAALGLAMLCFIFNAVGYQAPRATRQALNDAVAGNWFPLYTDVQSISIADFVLHDSGHRQDVHAAQTHDFLTGQTSFATIDGTHAFLLINEGFAARLQQRNLVKPIDPSGFGMHATQIAAAGGVQSASGGVFLAALGDLAAVAPAPAKRKLEAIIADAEDPAMVRVYRLNRQ
jgi:hypothetical protein